MLPVPDRCLSCLSVTLVYCGQTAGWIKMKFGTQVGLSHGYIVLDGDPAPPPPNGRSPNFQPISVVTKGWMDKDVTWYGCRPRPRPHCVRRGPSSPPAKAAQQPLPFRPMSIAATVAHLSYC